MYDGSLCGAWEAIVTFQQMIVLCDSDGVVDMTPQAIVARTGIPPKHIKAGIEVLGKPDKHSRSTAEDGRRIVPLDSSRPWGWKIVNYEYYKNLASRADKKEKDRARQSEKRLQVNKSAGVANSRGESQTVAEVAYVNVDLSSLGEHGLDLVAWSEWEQYRKKIRKPINSDPKYRLAAQQRMANLGKDQAAAVKHSIENGYQGLFGARNGTRGSSNETKPSAVERVQRATGGKRF